MPKVDMSRYVECPECHTWQITLNPCQKCVARKMAAEGRLPASGIVPYNPFKICAMQQKNLKTESKPKKPKECSEEKKERLRKMAIKGNETKRMRNISTKVPMLVSVLSDGQPHEFAKLIRKHIIPVGVTVTSWPPTCTMLQMGLLEWSKDGPNHNSPVRIWIPALKIQDAIDYAEELKNGKD